MFLRTGIAYLTCFAILQATGTTPQSCTPAQPVNTGPSLGEAVGVAAAVVGVTVIGTVVLVEEHKANHTIKGCVMEGASGLQVKDTDNGRVYDVSGVTANVKVGDVVRLHGDKEKKEKGETSQGFVIQKINKDYGPCKVAVAQTAAAPAKVAP